MQHLESVASRFPPAEIRALVDQQHISSGELLWQGKAGFCIATGACDRAEKCKMNVLRLQGTADSGLFMVNYLIPVRGLLDLLTKDMREAEVAEISRFLDEFEAQFGVGLNHGPHTKTA